MTARGDFEYLAMEAERHAETASSMVVAQGWRDIARGYRRLSEFVTHEQDVTSRSEAVAPAPELAEHRGWRMGR